MSVNNNPLLERSKKLFAKIFKKIKNIKILKYYLASFGRIFITDDKIASWSDSVDWFDAS